MLRPHELLAGALVALAPGAAGAIVGDSSEAVGVDGNVRTTAAATANYDNPFIYGFDNPSDGIGSLILRLTAEGMPVDWFSYELHAVESLNISTAPAVGVGFGASAGGSLRYKTFDLTWHQVEGEVDANLAVDRASLKFVTPYADITIGRQAITYGKAYFWNPLDVFFPFGAAQFDRDYKGGIDALRIEVPLGDFSGAEVVGVLGRGDEEEARWWRSAALARVFTNQWDWDFALQGGKVLGGYQLGAGAVGEVGPIEARAEAAYFWRQSTPARFAELPRPEDHLMAVVGIGRLFESSLFLSAEYLYNGAANVPLEQAFALVSRGKALHASEHIFGVLASYEFHPLITGSVAWIFSLSDRSMLIQPGLGYSAADEVDLIAGAIVALGDRPTSDFPPQLQSEFGTYPHFFYVETKIYF